jgi:SAM-dependent methyltransferase
MKLPIEFDWQRYRYFPYEKRLARREVETLLGVKPDHFEQGLRAKAILPSWSALERLTYFQEIRVNGTAKLIPLQTRLEASAIDRRVNCADLNFVSGLAPILTKQSTRYSAHGLHEYKGKFHPHIVRAIGNLLKLPDDAWVLDPFCGSGTCLLECAHVGWNAVGIDLNPLGVFISNAKLQALSVPLNALKEQVEELADRLQKRFRHVNFSKAFSLLAIRRLRRSRRFVLPNRPYLDQWFPPSVLVQLECIEEEIRRLKSDEVRNIARVVLSDGLRSASWQDPGDLRIRRRKQILENYPVVLSFVTALNQRVDSVVRARTIVGTVRGTQRAVLSDSRHGLGKDIVCLMGKKPAFDCIITSPPYATALPYIDTQRLSLAFLGLLSQKDIRKAETMLIGNREITQSERILEEAQIEGASNLLPKEVLKLCRYMQKQAGRPLNGFRRQNMPALVFRYFRDMREVFISLLPLVRPGGSFALVVGSNRTTLGGEEFKIDTPQLLGLVAKHVGWKLIEIIPLDAYQRFALHRKNSITNEALVILRRED